MDIEYSGSAEPHENDNGDFTFHPSEVENYSYSAEA